MNMNERLRMEQGQSSKCKYAVYGEMNGRLLEKGNLTTFIEKEFSIEGMKDGMIVYEWQ